MKKIEIYRQFSKKTFIIDTDKITFLTKENILRLAMPTKNPELDIVKACKIWNGLKTTEKYMNKIKCAYESFGCL